MSDLQFAIFEKRDPHDESSIWFYYWREITTGSHAKCKQCKKVLKTTGGSTKTLHLKSHNKFIKREAQKPEANTSNSSEKETVSGPTAPKVKRLISDHFSKSSENTLPVVILKMAALDGIAFRLFVTSDELRRCLVARGFIVPKSAATIRNMVVKFADFLREKLSEEFEQPKSKDQRFSFRFDEWSSCRNRRYINVNVHVNVQSWNDWTSLSTYSIRIFHLKRTPKN
jgi:hypothetical protein